METQNAVRGMERRQHEAEVSQEAWKGGRSWSSESFQMHFLYPAKEIPFVHKPRVTRKALHVACLKFHPRLGRHFQPQSRLKWGVKGEMRTLPVGLPSGVQLGPQRSPVFLSWAS